MRVSSATRSAAAFIGTAGIVAPGLAFATATPAAAVETQVPPDCTSVPRDTMPVFDPPINVVDAGQVVGHVNLYHSQSNGCWYGAVTSTFSSPTAVNALLRTGPDSDRHTISCFVASGTKCLTGGLQGRGNTDAIGMVKTFGGVGFGQTPPV
jgi:hypothetical protein